MGYVVMSKHYLWVYGTLKQGYANDHMMAGAEFLGDFHINGCIMYEGKFAPYLKSHQVLNVDARTRLTKGELYLVTSDLLEKLDRLEGHPHIYERMQIAWYTLIKDQPQVCIEAYLYKPDIPENSRVISEWTKKPTYEILSRL